MAMLKTITVCIGGTDTEITLRRLRKKELRPLAIALAERLDCITGIFGSGSIFRVLPDFLCDNLDFICRELILPFTNLKPELIEELDVADIISLLKELLEYNGISMEKLRNFFGTAVPGSTTAQTAQTPVFGGTAVP